MSVVREILSVNLHIIQRAKSLWWDCEPNGDWRIYSLAVEAASERARWNIFALGGMAGEW